jgi:topoisomerase-4 subunit A
LPLCNSERAVPAIEDGFSPFNAEYASLKELDDGRYNKVANVVGHTMQYHTGMQVSVMQWYRLVKKLI